MIHSAVRSLHSAVVFGRRVRTLADSLARMLPASDSLLDVGSGDGSIASMLRERRPEIRVQGIDVLVREGTKIPVQQFNGSDIPFESETFDVVSFIDVLHHTSNAIELIHEACRVTRRYILIKDHSAQTRLDHAILRAMDWVGNAPHGVALTYNYWSRAQWQAAFEKLNLAEEACLTDLHLYPAPIDWIFGRDLHFICLLRKTSCKGERS
jgi:SAM-dependent methyltransferase